MMPLFKKWDNSYNFTVVITGKSGMKKHYFIYLNEGTMVEIPYKADGKSFDSAKAINEPIHLHHKHGLMIWDVEDRAFSPLIDEFQRALSDYVADKALLDMPDSTIK